MAEKNIPWPTNITVENVRIRVWWTRNPDGSLLKHVSLPPDITGERSITNLRLAVRRASLLMSPPESASSGDDDASAGGHDADQRRTKG